MLHDLDLRLIAQGINITYTDSLKQYIIDESFDEAFGARPIKRFITKHIETFIATKIIAGEIKPNIPYVLDVVNDNYIISILLNIIY